MRMKGPTIRSAPWFARASEIAARVKAPAGKPFSAKKDGKVAKLYVYDVIGYDPWSGTGIDPMDVVAAVEEAKGSDALEIHINSPGGYITEGLAIFNAIRAFDGPKTSHVDGIAASMASVIALAADHIITSEGGMWMIHEPAGGIYVIGTADEIEEAAARQVNALRAMRGNMLDIYSNATGQTRDDISAWLAAETWMTGEEALARGFTDEIVKQDPVEASTAPPAARARTPSELVAFARAERDAIQHRFPGVIRAAVPGKPG